MKTIKLGKAILLLVFVLMLTTVSAFAVQAQENIFTAGSHTVGLVDGTHLSEEEKAVLLRYVLQHHIGAAQEEPEAAPANILCIFGHDEVVQRAYAITHKVDESDPRCKKTLYTVTTCTRCDYKDIVRIGTQYISCCPEE